MIITVHAKPRAKKNEVVRLDETTYKISVTAAAEKGKANEAILDMLAKELRLAKSRVALVRGQTIPFKQFKILD